MNYHSLTVLILSAITIAILLNLIIPQILLPLAEKDEKKMNDEDLGIKGNMMKMIVHHSKIPLTSSVIIGIFVAISVYLATFIKIRPSEIKSINNRN